VISYYKLYFLQQSRTGSRNKHNNASGKLVFGIFAALSEFERELISKRTKAGLAAARARGREGGRSFKLAKPQVRLVKAAMKNRDYGVTELCHELGISRQALYKYEGSEGELRDHGKRVLDS
jgi:DNA invertase Pin-like site-specific DNA recombinase